LEETFKYIHEHRFDDVKKLAFASYPPNVDLPFALSQISGRQTVKNKIPSWYETNHIIYPKHLPLEQCSSEATAKYKASLVTGDSLVDLTGGFGVDCAFLSRQFKSVVYVERLKELCEIAGNNFKILGLNHIQVIHEESIRYLEKMNPVDCIYIDPARRNETGKKIVAIQDCEPNIIELKKQLQNKAETIMIKLSPMLDISSALQALPEVSDIQIVSIDGECKELLFILKKGIHKEPVITCVNIQKNENMQTFSFFKTEEQNIPVNYTSKPKDFIYEPNSSILKAGAYKSIAHKYNLQKLHPDSHLYTSSEYMEAFPGRIFKVISTFSLNKKEIKENLNGIKQANISIRNFPGSVDELRKKLKLKEGGDVYLFATTLFNGKHIIIFSHKPFEPHCHKRPPHNK